MNIPKLALTELALAELALTELALTKLALTELALTELALTEIALTELTLIDLESAALIQSPINKTINQIFHKPAIAASINHNPRTAFDRRRVLEGLRRFFSCCLSTQ